MTSIEFENLDALNDWLRSQNPNVSVAIAVRSAIRAIVVGFPVLSPADPQHRADIILPVLRLIAASWVTAKYQTHRADLNNTHLAAREAALAVDVYATANSAHAPAHAASAAFNASNAALANTNAQDAASAAHFAYANAYSTASIDDHNIAAFASGSDADIHGDVRFIASSADPLTASHILCSRPLFSAPFDYMLNRWNTFAKELAGPKDVPDPLLGARRVLAKGNEVPGNRETWHVWTDWIDARIRGASTIEALEVERALIPGEEWEKGPGHVNHLIAEMIERYERSGNSPEEATRIGRPHIFLSYSRIDRAIASKLKASLEDEGLSIWWDQMIDPGMDWDAELRRRVKSAHSVLVLWSEASAASEHVRDEAQRARRANTVAPVMIEPLSEDQLPQPFGGRHTLDLSHWDGARDDAVFQRLVKFLKHRQAGADSPLTVDATEDGDIRLRERPVGAAPEREDDVTRDRLIGAQVKLAERTAAQARRAPNAPPDLPDRLDEYAEELKAEGEKFWEVIDDAFAPAAGLLKPEELTDDGLTDAAQRLLDRHRDLRTYIQPMQPADKPPRKDEVEPDKAEILIPELRATRELAAHPDLPQIGPAIPRVLDTAAEHIEEEAANLPRNDTEAEQRRTRVGRALQNAIGVATGLATAMTYHSYALSEAGKALLGKLDKLIDELVKLLP